MLHKSSCVLLGVGVTVLLAQPSTAWAQTVGPDLIIAKSHSGNFTVGTNGTFTIVVSNIGRTASSGEIDVNDQVVGIGLDLFGFVSAAGNGWSCAYRIGFPSEAVQCSTSNVIAPGGSAFPITLTVRPIASGTNTVTVEGGGDTVLTNNSDSDVFIVVPAVPTLPQWAMMALTALLVLAGVAALRRRMT